MRAVAHARDGPRGDRSRRPGVDAPGGGRGSTLSEPDARPTRSRGRARRRGTDRRWLRDDSTGRTARTRLVLRRMFEPGSVTGTSNVGVERRERRSVPAAARRTRAVGERRARRATTAPVDHDPTRVDGTASVREPRLNRVRRQLYRLKIAFPGGIDALNESEHRPECVRDGEPTLGGEQNGRATGVYAAISNENDRRGA